MRVIAGAMTPRSMSGMKMKVGDLVEVPGKGQGEVMAIMDRRVRVLLDSGGTVWREPAVLTTKSGEKVVPPSPRVPPKSMQEELTKRHSKQVELRELGLLELIQGGGKSKLKHASTVDKAMPIIEEDVHVGSNPMVGVLQDVKSGQMPALKHAETVDRSAPVIEKDIHFAPDPRPFLMNEIRQANVFSHILFPAETHHGRASVENVSEPQSPPPSNRTSLVSEMRKMKYDQLDINCFELKRTLGVGTFGRVRLVQHKKSGRYHALKILRKADVIALREDEHVRNERTLLALVDHPFIVNLLGTFQDRRNLYMCMEFMAGGELYTMHRSHGVFENNTARFFVAQLVLALQYLHDNGVVYRDLKLENVLVGTDGYVKMGDFGSAKCVEDQTFTMCGTPEYQAPEIVRHKGHGRAADSWALGVLIYELLAGETPFVADTPMEVYKNVFAGTVTYPDHFEPSAVDLISRILLPDPKARLTIAEIKDHEWLAGMDYAALLRRKLPAPQSVLEALRAGTKSEGDPGMFAKIPEADLFSGPVIDPKVDNFPEF